MEKEVLVEEVIEQLQVPFIIQSSAGEERGAVFTRAER
jgi:hypothetical protein